jgi:hypothetical protein
MFEICQIEKLLVHPFFKTNQRTLRIYFTSGFRVTVWKDGLSYVGHDPLTYSWNTCAPELPEDVAKLINPIVEENREWLLQ